MKKIPLTQGKYTLVDDEDFEWLSQWKWYSHHGYAVRNKRYGPRKENKQHYVQMHRFILGAKEGDELDHINRNRADNRKNNLRFVTRSLNQWNVGLRTDNKSGIRGVYWNTKERKWIVQLRAHNKTAHYSSWRSKMAAALAYKLAERLHRGIATSISTP